MPRFFVNPSENEAVITGDGYRHLTRALRVRTGDLIEVTDGKFLYSAKITEIDSEKVLISLFNKREDDVEPKVKLTLVQGLPKGEKAELIIQKAVELGAYKIVFFAADRSIVKLDAKQRAQKQERFLKIAASAAEQSGRSFTPEVKILSSLEEALKEVNNAVLVYEKANENTLTTVLEQINSDEYAFIIGPEGGISEKEAAYCEGKNIPAITLGKRILRTETAAIAVVASAMCLLHELE